MMHDTQELIRNAVANTSVDGAVLYVYKRYAHPIVKIVPKIFKVAGFLVSPLA